LTINDLSRKERKGEREEEKNGKEKKRKKASRYQDPSQSASDTQVVGQSKECLVGALSSG
jgi:hypothetical protein